MHRSASREERAGRRRDEQRPGRVCGEHDTDRRGGVPAVAGRALGGRGGGAAPAGRGAGAGGDIGGGAAERHPRPLQNLPDAGAAPARPAPAAAAAAVPDPPRAAGAARAAVLGALGGTGGRWDIPPSARPCSCSGTGQTGGTGRDWNSITGDTGRTGSEQGRTGGGTGSAGTGAGPPRYYAFDEALARELLGKKLSKGTKKELDEISARTGVGIRSCRRQFDNFKRVFKAVEELRGPLAENIQQLFLLPPPLARDYAAIVFFANSRFETGKRRLQFLTFGDFAACAQSMMGHWSQGALAPEAAEPDGDLPKSFLQDLKELKVLVTDKDLLDQHKSLVCSALRGKISVYNELEANFKALSRALVNVGGKLTHARDVRDFFVDLVEKVIEPCRSDKWSPGDLRLFLTQYTAAPRNLPGFRHQALWERYMAAITACLLRMYHD